MSTFKKLKNILKELMDILKEEKEALINNDSSAVAGLVERKIEIVSILENQSKETVETDEEILKLVGAIKELQETNLLLTKQALKFQENLIESIAENIKAVAETYSQKGEYKKQTQNINLVDQKV